MIKLFRIDERLIHGQIAIKWSRHTGVDSIVVANDHAAENVMIQNNQICYWRILDFIICLVIEWVSMTYMLKIC